MKKEIEVRGKAAVIKLAGDLDYNSCTDFFDKTIEIINSQISPVVIDMGSVGHIDSMGLGTLTKLWKGAEQRSVSFVLADVPSNVGKLIKLINLDNRIRIFDDTETALKQ